MIDYEIVSLRPKQLFMQVVYRSEGQPDFFINFNPEQFDGDYLQNMIVSNAGLAQAYWDKISEAPETVEGDFTTGSIRPVVDEPMPFFNYDTEIAEPTVIESQTEIRNSWIVRDLTELELQDRVLQSRKGTSITMRQCRLALLAEGKLAEVETAIAALSEPTKTAAALEWEYGSVVERTSPFVATLGLAIGYSDAQLDALFFSAISL